MNAAQKYRNAVEDWHTGVRTCHNGFVIARTLARRDQRDRFAGFGMRMLHVTQVAWINLAIGRTIMNDDTKRSARILHHRGQAACHLFTRIATATAPCVQRIHDRQFGVDDFFDRRDCFIVQHCQRDARLVGQVDHQLPLAT